MTKQLSPNSVRTYHLAPEAFAAARNRLLQQRILLFAGILLFLLAIVYKQFGEVWHSKSVASLIPASLLVLILLAALASGVKKGIRREQESWNSFELIIGEDFLVRRIKNFPELEIQRHEVIAIRETSTGLRVATAQKDRAIGIASSLVDYEDAKERLSRWVVPTQESQGRWMTPARWSSAIGILVLVLFACLYLSDRSWLIVATGVPLFVGLCVSIWLIRRSVQVSAQMKRLSFVALFPLLAVAGKVILAIINWR